MSKPAGYNEALAMSQGWLLAEDAERGLEIQRYDGDPQARFDGDAAALEHVRSLARADRFSHAAFCLKFAGIPVDPPTTIPHSKHWMQIQEHSGYIDFERSDPTSLHLDGLSRVTLVLDTHTAYAMRVNPTATLTNDVPVHSDESVEMTWDEALALLAR